MPRKAVSKPSKQAGRSLADFRAAHDKSFIVPARITAGLKLLGAGWEYEVPFSKLCGISLIDLGNYREAFEEHFIVTSGNKGKRVWSGSKETIQKMGEML